MTCFVENTEEILRNYILHPQISIHNPEPEIIKRIPNVERLYSITSCTASTTLAPRRDLITGKIIDFIEVPLENADATANNSMSLKRCPGPLEQATRGSPMNFPFWPGGFEEPEKHIEKLNIDLDLKELLTVPPGFTKGLNFETKQENLLEDKTKIEVNLLDALANEYGVFNPYADESENQIIDKLDHNEDDVKDLKGKDENVDDILKSENVPFVLEISKAPERIVNKTEWAEVINVTEPVTDFNIKVPEPAKVYPFELDIFQKQAIIKLEEGQYVFVAAHTSAGKTVVAEYAIALSQKHMTRTIYTSPIKALSNQKYRDFKNMFKDVGLITGDYQTNPTAACLIMTTEILRSMLYCGSDVTRDLEYVIFDEVHYVNDSDRGHVWEEVIILLPDHVKVVMLSATVPNTLEFANWVGNIKKQKVYVISTLKRPVPLMHYLYTGCGQKAKRDMFLIVNEKNDFLAYNFKEAMENIPELKSWGPRQDKTLWEGFMHYLKKNNKLPVVAFTLSRKRCDDNAIALKSADLNNAREKSEAQNFFSQCLKKLKPADRKLPQVQLMKDSLERGIGIHHSGILPILKEIVELLFEKGLVKMLFATETFAMGVNMPAKTVIFDSYTKFDGTTRRYLKPAEYIQMAGRAGRRGHDETGTVIIVCKNKIQMGDLQSIIQGKPEKLQSKFLLRYAMILKCFKTESYNVEDIMFHSFKEFDNKLESSNRIKELQTLREKKLALGEINETMNALSTFFDIGSNYIKEKQSLIKNVLSKANNKFKPGQILIICHGKHLNKLAIFLSGKTQFFSETDYKVLVLDNAIKENKDNSTKKCTLEQNDRWLRLLALTPDYKFFYPEGMGGYQILDIKLTDVVHITKNSVKIDANIILQNRQDENTHLTITKAVTDLNVLNDSYNANPATIQIQEIKIIDPNLLDQINIVNKLEKQLKEILPALNIANFEEQFHQVFTIKILEEKIKHVEFLNSPKNYKQSDEYYSKLAVLKTLQYIDEQNEVTLKGDVASAIGQNELLLTELIFCNFFNDLDSAEIAALLSSLVFQAKTKTEPKWEADDKLFKCIMDLQKIDAEVQQVERVHGVTSYEMKERLNFGLVKVVYEWACNKPFATIMELTDTEEGIIVRCIQQLDEILRDVKTAAQTVGNPALQSKMEEASTAIKRDIVFTASLYTDLQ